MEFFFFLDKDKGEKNQINVKEKGKKNLQKRIFFNDRIRIRVFSPIKRSKVFFII